MEKFNRQEQLKQLHAERKVKTEKKVDKAINDLVQKIKKLTLTSFLNIQKFRKLHYIKIIKFENRSYVNKTEKYLFIKIKMTVKMR